MDADGVRRMLRDMMRLRRLDAGDPKKRGVQGSPVQVTINVHTGNVLAGASVIAMSSVPFCCGHRPMAAPLPECAPCPEDEGR